MATSSKTPLPCPCGGPGIMRCCGPYIAGAELPPTAEALMRSRYVAFKMQDEAYLRATWHPSTRPTEPIVNKDEKIQWLGLEIKSGLRLRQADLPEDPDKATVEFVARYKINGRAYTLHEISRFVREPDPALGGKPRWFYLDGSFPEYPE
ncbi:YchJ family metal-binding protein [Massilia sp. YIM B02763]|uniref:YchJ family protein n=1 Tax=Massilia sp. YIM B02763 TaxID=3050130 RepID=UPI0025B69F67|nr:YchJ family metal-binding protein [Massilia sp. YIM B02763]MDN4055371.1 YchJ family metal-binding protein [Massilia sp. YIM B02763]